MEKLLDSCIENEADTPPSLLSTSIASERGFPADTVVAIVGPTGSGKSDLALRLAAEFDGEIVNCDSVQVYRDLNIGSAKTPACERRGIPHHLIDILSVTEELSAGEYTRLARPAVRSILDRRKVALVVGGTGFYFRALFDGLCPAPSRDPNLRSRLAALERAQPLALHRYLRVFDPAAARRIHPQDTQKLIRAVEVIRLLGQPLSVTQSQPREPFEDIRLLTLGLTPDRKLLYQRLNRRTEEMFANGLVAETEHIISQLRDSPIPRVLDSVGYREAVELLRGQLTLAEAIERASARTRQYAKRQLTWFRADSRIVWLHGFGWETEIQNEASARIRSSSDVICFL